MKKTEFAGRFRRGDAAAIAFVLAAAFLLLFVQLFSVQDGNGTVRVRSETGTQSYPLGRDGTYMCASGGYTLRIEIQSGAVRLAESDCPTQACAASAAISRAGQCIVCLPAHVVITIDGGEEDADWILP